MLTSITGKHIVYNELPLPDATTSPDMHQLVDYIVADSDGQSPVQVDIQAKFVEFSQNNLKELSFDWLLGQSKLANSNVYTGGGTPKVGT